MPRYFLPKSMSVLAAVSLGVLLGGRLVGLAGEPRRQGPAPAPGHVTVVGGRNQIVFPNDQPGQRIASPRPGHLIVDARSEVTNRDLTQPFYWSVRVVANTRPATLVREVSYDQQAFEIRTGETVTPSFYDEIPVPPGRYQVMLQLRSFHDLRKPDGTVFMEDYPIASKVFYQTVQ